MRHIRRVLVIGAVLLATLLFTETASAVEPVRVPFDVGGVFVDSEVCAAAPWGFDVSVVDHFYGWDELFFNQDGSLAKVVAHVDYDATMSANGKTIVERDTWQVLFYPDGTLIFVGLYAHIQGPGGIVLRDAGLVVFNPDGSINYVRGPHEQLVDSVSFCPALAP